MPTIGTFGPAASRRALRILGRFAPTSLNASCTQVGSIPVSMLPQISRSLAPMSIVTSFTDPRCVEEERHGVGQLHPEAVLAPAVTRPLQHVGRGLGDRAAELLQLEVGGRGLQGLVELVGVPERGRVIDVGGIRLDADRQRVAQRQVPDLPSVVVSPSRDGHGDEANQDHEHGQRLPRPSGSHRISSAPSGWGPRARRPGHRGAPVDRARRPPLARTVSGRGVTTRTVSRGAGAVGEGPAVWGTDGGSVSPIGSGPGRSVDEDRADPQRAGVTPSRAPRRR